MTLLTPVALLHNQLLVAVLLIALGFLGMLLQRNAFSMVFSLLLWLQGAGLICAAYGQSRGAREGSLSFLLIVLFLLPLLSMLTFLIIQSRRRRQTKREVVSETDSPYRIFPDQGADSGG
ncbi:NADH-quinone oxidoreductase subunit K [Gimesia algae]|uniref:NAD(P)H-quinone oxidoreductase subunit 4L, chloroplastic n=1 Tax=Gimesia algae TaxID=2527971 RepID=A0A517VDS0_9PLAN|nr:NADH-quinone oxidoreductase subunit K [Gimesia algae]QDT91145.1 NAD(P)H-quinone oxidoreductase subunit 4L, chloroplastic [Gimesia algae]